MQKFGTNLSKRRKALGLSQKELGEKLGIAQSTVAGYESGARFPSVEILTSLATVTGASVDELLGFQNRSSSPS